MPESKPKAPKDPLDLKDPEYFVLTEPEPVEIGSGFSISVSYDKRGRPQLCVRKYGVADIKGLRRELERTYPGCIIKGLEKSQQIKVEVCQKKKKLKRKSSKKPSRKTGKK